MTQEKTIFYEMRKSAGFREKYAMQHGTATKKTEAGRVLYVFTYSAADPYQDANGATYDATGKNWIG